MANTGFLNFIKERCSEIEQQLNGVVQNVAWRMQVSFGDKPSKKTIKYIEENYEKTEFVFTTPEYPLYKILSSIIPYEQYRIFPKVRLSYLAKTKNVANQDMKEQNRLWRCVDFLVCDAQHCKPKLVIQLNHQIYELLSASRKRYKMYSREQDNNNAWVQVVCKKKNIPMLYISESDCKVVGLKVEFDIEKLTQKLENKLHIRQSEQPDLVASAK